MNLVFFFLDNIPYTGRLIALNKWECANQIGSITLHHTSDGTPSLLIAQPGGTFMRVRCQTDESSQNQESLEQSQSSGYADFLWFNSYSNVNTLAATQFQVRRSTINFWVFLECEINIYLPRFLVILKQKIRLMLKKKGLHMLWQP